MTDLSDCHCTFHLWGIVTSKQWKDIVWEIGETFDEPLHRCEQLLLDPDEPYIDVFDLDDDEAFSDLEKRLQDLGVGYALEWHGDHDTMLGAAPSGAIAYDPETGQRYQTPVDENGLSQHPDEIEEPQRLAEMKPLIDLLKACQKQRLQIANSSHERIAAQAQTRA